MLGVTSDFTEAPLAKLTSNKLGRVQQVNEEIDKALSEDQLIKAPAAFSFCGRLLFAEQQCSGRFGSLASKVIGEKGSGRAALVLRTMTRG